jgi:hypothetical protein
MFSIICFGSFVKYQSSGMLRFDCASHGHGLAFALGFFQRAHLMEHGCPIDDLPFSSFRCCAEFLVIGLYFL